MAPVLNVLNTEGLTYPFLIECPLSRSKGWQILPLPAPFLLYAIRSIKNEKPENGKIAAPSRAFH